jgi:hypothetical protein
MKKLLIPFFALVLTGAIIGYQVHAQKIRAFDGRRRWQCPHRLFFDKPGR